MAEIFHEVHEISVCPQALYQLGLRNKIEKNAKKAAPCFISAADQGHYGAQYQLGMCFKTGRGVKIILIQAAYWFRRSADQGNAEAQYKILKG